MKYRFQIVSFAMCLLWPVWGQAQITDDTMVRRMIQEGRFDEALANLDVGLKKNPRDAQLHLLRGATLSMANRKGDALKAFAKMVDQRIEVAAAYNNIAVILASRGEFDGARTALECALKANPNYVTAQQNMAEVYANLSHQAYRQAQHMDRSDPSIANKLAHLNQLLGPSANQMPVKPAMPQDGRYYDQPCTPEPLQVARRPLDTPVLTSINPSPEVPAQLPQAPAPVAPAPAPGTVAPAAAEVLPALPGSAASAPTPSRTPVTPLPGRGNPSAPVQQPLPAPLPERMHASEQDMNKPKAIPAAPPLNPPEPQAPVLGLRWSRPATLPRASASVPEPAAPAAAVLDTEKVVGLSFSMPKRLGPAAGQ